MTESKIGLTERLRREGRWSEATRFKDETIAQLRSEGMKRIDAATEAWKRTAEKYPPLAETDSVETTAAVQQPEEAGDDVDVDALLDRVGDRQPPDLVRDTLWVYQNIENRGVKPENAPSLGAWSLLKWARDYRNRFFEQILPKALVNKPANETEGTRRERKSIAEVERSFADLDESWRAELIVNTPATILAGVRSRLTDWAGRFGLVLPNGAQAILEAHLAEFVHDCAKTIAGTAGGK